MKHLLLTVTICLGLLVSCDEFGGTSNDFRGSLSSFLVLDSTTFEDLLDSATEGFYAKSEIEIYRMIPGQKYVLTTDINAPRVDDNILGSYELSFFENYDHESDAGKTFTYYLKFRADIDTFEVDLTQSYHFTNYMFNGSEFLRMEKDSLIGKRYTILK